MSNRLNTDPQPLVPPSHYFRAMAFCHWVERIDFDGRPCGLEVWQWQPFAKSWCLPNRHATGAEGNLLEGYVWRGLCPTPAFKEETDEVVAIFNKTSITSEDVAVLRRYFSEQWKHLNGSKEI